MSVLSRPYFHNEQAAFDFVEGIIWANGPVCPHCGGFEKITVIKPNPEKRVRFGLKKCGQCKGQFTVRMGTIFEESKLPMTKWLQAIFLMTASKKGVSAHQLHRTLEVTYKTAWFMSHRIREAMRAGDLAPFGQGGGMVVDHLDAAKVAEILTANIAKEARLMTDEARFYMPVGREFADHKSVAHARGEYVREGDVTIHTNTVEGFYSVFKRGMKGANQHASRKHLHGYAAEFDFRYSNRVAVGVDDTARAVKALQGVVGKRLTYQRTNERPEGVQA